MGSGSSEFATSDRPRSRRVAGRSSHELRQAATVPSIACRHWTASSNPRPEIAQNKAPGHAWSNGSPASRLRQKPRGERRGENSYPRGVNACATVVETGPSWPSDAGRRAAKDPCRERESPAGAGLSSQMRMRGLEPPRSYLHTDLNRARLPIPPHPHAWAQRSDHSNGPLLTLTGSCRHRLGD
jgi:hypothetical protein